MNGVITVTTAKNVDLVVAEQHVVELRADDILEVVEALNDLPAFGRLRREKGAFLARRAGRPCGVEVEVDHDAAVETR